MFSIERTPGLNVTVTQTLKNTKVRPLFFFLKEGSCTLLKRVNPFHLLCFKSKWQQDGAPVPKISNGCADVDYRPLLGTYFSLVLLFAGVFVSPGSMRRHLQPNCKSPILSML